MDFKKIREQFPMVNTKMEGNKLIYFDSSATTFKPYKVIEAVNSFYNQYTSSVHRGDYQLSSINDQKFKDTRLKIKEYINAKSEKEIVFIPGTTFGINQIVFGYYKYFLKNDDEIILSELEHAANLLPWFKLASDLGLKIKYVNLDVNHNIIIDDNLFTKKTKVVALSHVNNTIGNVLNLKKLQEMKEKYHFHIVLDAAQSIAHFETDVSKYDIDFLTFSAHKMYGPSGIGVLYGKTELLEKTEPLLYGGGMNTSINKNGTFTYKKNPEVFEGGTPNAEGVYGLNAAIDFINEIGIKNIHNYEMDLKKYALSLLNNPNIEIYNRSSESAVLIINIKDVFAQDLATYLGTKGIAVRNGLHCAKLTPHVLKTPATIRIALNIYNTKEEIAYLSDVLNEVVNNPDIVLSWI